MGRPPPERHIDCGIDVNLETVGTVVEEGVCQGGIFTFFCSKWTNTMDGAKEDDIDTLTSQLYSLISCVNKCKIGALCAGF